MCCRQDVIAKLTQGHVNIKKLSLRESTIECMQANLSLEATTIGPCYKCNDKPSIVMNPVATCT